MYVNVDAIQISSADSKISSYGFWICSVANVIPLHFTKKSVCIFDPFFSSCNDWGWKQLFSGLTDVLITRFWYIHVQLWSYVFCFYIRNSCCKIKSLGSLNLNLLWYVLSFLFLLTSQRIKQNFASFLVFLIICTILTGFVKAGRIFLCPFAFMIIFKWNEANLGTIFPHVVLWPVFMLVNNAIVFQNCLYIFFCNVIILFITVLFHMSNVSCILFHQIPQFPLPQT